MTDRAKAMDNLIAQDADLIDKLRDEDSYYRLQEKHWCIDAEELERQRLAAADRIEASEAENERLREALQFYAREYNWKSCGVYMCGHSGPSSAEIDRGNKARAALAGDGHD